MKHLFLKIFALLILGVLPSRAITQSLARAHNQVSLAVLQTQSEERSLKDVLKEFKRHYHIDIVFFNSTVDGFTIKDKEVVFGKEFETSLRNLLRPYDLQFNKGKSGSYVIIPKEAARPDGNPVKQKKTNSQVDLINLKTPTKNDQKESVIPIQQEVRGTVTDENGVGLPGVSIRLKSTLLGTISDADGRYRLELPEQSDKVLVFSYVGYLTQEKEIENEGSVDIKLIPDQKSLEEVVVVGYGTQKKRDVTGSVASVDLEAFREAPNLNILQSLQGSVPGIQIGQVNQAGQEPNIQIRGQNSLSGSTSPLIVVDGIMFRGRLSDLNPADIKSVDVLKDASSKAIYGAQAANGVILITTFSGKTAQSPVINYSASFSTQNPTVKARLLNREETLQKVRDIEFRNAYQAPDYTNLNPSWDFNLSEMRPLQLEGIAQGTDFDWWDALTNTGHIQDHQLSVAGSTEATSYYISGGISDQKGIILNDRFKRATARINVETAIKPWLSLGANTFGSFLNLSGKHPSMNTIATGTSPLVSPYGPEGQLVINPRGDVAVNPFLDAQADDQDKVNRISGNFYSVLTIPSWEGFSYRINYSNNMRWWNQANSNKYGAGLTGTASKENGYVLDVLFDHIITYDKKLNNHGINLTMVAGYNRIKSETTLASGTNIPNLSLSYNSLQQAVNRTISSNAYRESSLYQMIRANYNFKSRYMLTATLRRDGFSGFAKNKKIGLFPSVGAAWVVSEEPFFKIPAISYFKLRASYGQNGNQTARYSSLARVVADESSQYVFGDGTSTSLGQYPASLANDNLTWESTAGTNFGLDFNLFKDNIKGSVDYYHTATTNLFWDMSLPRMTGFSNISTNLGKIVNRGIEFLIQTQPIRGTKFQWNLDVNFSSNRNEIVHLLNVDRDGDGREDDLVASNLFIGHSIGTVYNYETNGIWQLTDEIPTGFFPGTYRVVDQNGDGIISADQDRKILGRSEPSFQMGIQNTFRLSPFTLRIFINSIQGGKSGYMGANHPTGFPDTRSTAQHGNWFNFYDYWSPTNPDGKYPLPWEAAQVKPVQYFSRSFVRLQDISLSYQLPKAILHKIGLKSASVYASGKNVLTLTKWDGWDPETGQGISNSNPYPVMKAYTLGLTISL